jgi:hypothetical protein
VRPFNSAPASVSWPTGDLLLNEGFVQMADNDGKSAENYCLAD